RPGRRAAADGAGAELAAGVRELPAGAGRQRGVAAVPAGRVRRSRRRPVHRPPQGLAPAEGGWRLGRALYSSVETLWDKPDEGIWEVRGPRQHFTHSKVMAWVAIDRAVKSAEQFGLDAPLDRWKKLRDTIHAQVCARGYNREMNSFTQAYDSKLLDASLLMIPLVGFLPPEDRRVQATVAAIEKHLLRGGFVARYDTSQTEDGLPPGEGAFLPCTFWYAD